MKKVDKVITLKGNDYAKVADRLKIFREENPNSKIMTETRSVDGKITFKAYIWKNKDELIDLVKSGVDKETIMITADSNGTAQKEIRNGDKDFEKLETVAVGRALALLGYLASGEIASSEEMEEFEDFKKQKVADQSKELIAKLKASKNLKELQDNFVKGVNKFKGNNEVIAELIKIKDELKGELK